MPAKSDDVFNFVATLEEPSVQLHRKVLVEEDPHRSSGDRHIVSSGSRDTLRMAVGQSTGSSSRLYRAAMWAPPRMVRWQERRAKDPAAPLRTARVQFASQVSQSLGMVLLSSTSTLPWWGRPALILLALCGAFLAGITFARTDGLKHPPAVKNKDHQDS